MVEKQSHIKHLILKMFGFLFVSLSAYWLVAPIKLELIKPDDKEMVRVKISNYLLKKKIDSLETIIKTDSIKTEQK